MGSQALSASQKEFFRDSELLDYMVLRPLDHIRPNWELTWNEDEERYELEDESYAKLLNQLIDDIASCAPPAKYHENEDRVAETMLHKTGWDIRKINRRWKGADYFSILEQGGWNDLNQQDLLLAATGRVQAAIDRGQMLFDDMEEGHRYMLGAVLSIILYHRENYA